MISQSMRFTTLITISMLAATTGDLAAQTIPPTSETVPTANSEDVTTIDGIVGALYASISGPAGEARNWNRFLSLFDPTARLIPTSFNPNTSSARARVWSPADYIGTAGSSLEEGGFFEREIGRVTDEFEGIAQVFSTYESRRTEDGPLIAKGINSIQLLWDGQRWWIFNIFWRGVGPDDEIPARYLNND